MFNLDDTRCMDDNTRISNACQREHRQVVRSRLDDIDLPCKVDGGSPTNLFGINDAWAGRRWRRVLVQEGLHLIGVAPHRVTLDLTLLFFLTSLSVN